MATNFHLAPPARAVDGFLAVPIDIQWVKATIVFDGSTQTATADATIEYTVGPTSGNPIFDLRQTISQAWVDGVLFSPGQLASHDFGAGTFSELRIIESVQAAGSVHTLRVKYSLEMPQSELTGGYPPIYSWSAGPRLTYAFGLSDLRAGRYAEAWLPANLLFDQFSIDLDIQLVNVPISHSVITNGVLTIVAANHWTIAFPDRFSALSPLLEIRTTSTLVSQTDSVLLPVSGKTVVIEVWKLTISGVVLTSQINTIKDLLTANETNYGPYLHEERYVAFFNGGGGMEYEGGTTTDVAALPHETFHSWFARGIKPAGQSDGWWDEAFTSFHDAGADDPVPFDFINPPILLCSRDPWTRRTPTNSYSDGSAFWRGMAALLGVGNVNSLMRDLYNLYKGQPVSTAMMEEFLVSRSGNAQVVDAFHRFVYGLPNPSPAPDLWLRDDPAHTGANEWGGTFWDSPDLWTRRQDDGLTTHQSPRFGQDNWFYARIRNKSTAGTARHFVVTFTAKSFAGTQFVYPADFLPAIAAKAEFELAPGETRVVKARWPQALVPPAGTHACMLASVISRADHPTTGLHVWEHNNLAQKNLTVVALAPESFIVIPVVLINTLPNTDEHYWLEVWRDKRLAQYPVSLIHSSSEFFGSAKRLPLQTLPNQSQLNHWPIEDLLDCGGHRHGDFRFDKLSVLTSDTPEQLTTRFPKATEAILPDGQIARIRTQLSAFSPTVVGLKVSVPRNARPGEQIKTHFVQRHVRTKQVTGGIAVVITVKEKP